jgi:hypothetical protein
MNDELGRIWKEAAVTLIFVSNEFACKRHQPLATELLLRGTEEGRLERLK